MIPVANMVISSVLLIGFLKLFSSQVVYQYREIYLEINDTENQILTEFQTGKQAGLHALRTYGIFL